MATPASLRADLAALVGASKSDLAAIWRLPEDEQVEALRDLLPDVVDSYWFASATLGADFYDEVRAEQGVAGRFSALVREPDDLGTQALIGWAASVATDDAAFRQLVEGGVTRRVLNGSRGTIARSSLADPQAEGWMRVGVGACSFCRLLISRGAVYSAESVRFAAHDSCQCQAIAKFKGNAALFDVQAYRRSTRNRPAATREADNARARRWIEDNNI